MSYVLVNFSRDWADEFSMEGSCVMTSQEWEDYQKAAHDVGTINVSFGTNEGWDDEDPDDWLSSFKTTVIPDCDAEAFIRLFPGSYGQDYRDRMTAYCEKNPDAAQYLDQWLSRKNMHICGYFPEVPTKSDDEDY